MLARDQRGVVFPSPVVILSILAVAMAGVAWVATRNPTPNERQVTPAAVTHSPSAHHSSYSPPKPKHTQPSGPTVDRGKVVVEVFNNSSISGLAGRVAGQVAHAGWQVVGSDNWYGTIPASTVYYPPRLKAAGHLLALDLGIRRTMPAVTPMRLDRLTVILTGPTSTSTH
ncbi:LytR C-terminal domain-containing protein [Nocardioides cynanchi]|uniref:LytR C-terminal domain-containing protein n=1 Tax=Nocardioides cynanchi TaxID=2558918 RepID=UPI001245DA3A|nr:LytR C-terminal domain-containing protein [Nocardioides cynanchi]